jgi:hypothetical protein
MWRLDDHIPAALSTGLPMFTLYALMTWFLKTGTSAPFHSYQMKYSCFQKEGVK